MFATEFDTTAKPDLAFVLDHITECRNSIDGDKPCGRTPVAIATDPDLPADDNLFPICSDCLVEHGGENEKTLPLADFVNLLIEQGILLPNAFASNRQSTMKASR